MAGFVAGEGCFFVDVQNSNSHKTGKQAKLKFVLTQHLRDEVLLKTLKNYWGCGRIVKINNVSVVRFVVTKFSDIDEKIIPFFKKYPIHGIKLLDFMSFCEVGELIKTKEHLTESGLEKIIKIKSKMNKTRIYYALENSPSKP